MEVERLETLVRKWGAITDNVAKYEDIRTEQMYELLIATNNALREFSKDELVPKVMSKLFLEMEWCAFWVKFLEENPMNKYHHVLGDIIIFLKSYFFDEGFKDDIIDKLIDEFKDQTNGLEYLKAEQSA